MNEEVEKKFREETGINITCHENIEEKIVFSLKFKNSEVEKQKNELIERNMKDADNRDENLTLHFIDEGGSLVYNFERRESGRVIKESYREFKDEKVINSKKPVEQINQKEGKKNENISETIDPNRSQKTNNNYNQNNGSSSSVY